MKVRSVPVGVQKTPIPSTPNGVGLVSYSLWLDSIPIARRTGHSWIEKGWLRTINIAGKKYVDRKEITRFMRRAARGEFEKPPHGAALASKVAAGGAA